MTYLELSNSNSLTLTLYTPEAIRSCLPFFLDEYIHRQTGLVSIYRESKIISGELLRRFYQNSTMVNDPVLWPLINMLFTTGPSTITLWKGKNAIDKMLKIKGRTHPADATSDSVRGRFWCDNPLCNLMHSSDSPLELAREMSLILLPSFIEGNVDIVHPMEFKTQPIVRHSGIILFHQRLCSLIYRSATIKQIRYTDKAEEVNRLLTSDLLRIIRTQPLEINTLINAFLQGDTREFDEYAGLVPFSDWERLMIRCSLEGRKKWNSIFKVWQPTNYFTK